MELISNFLNLLTAPIVFLSKFHRFLPRVVGVPGRCGALLSLSGLKLLTVNVQASAILLQRLGSTSIGIVSSIGLRDRNQIGRASCRERVSSPV